MDALLNSAIHLPDWVIYGIVGAVFGGIGGLLGSLLQRFMRLPQLTAALAAAGTVVSLSITKLFVIPAIVTANMNADLPKAVDEVTTLLRADYDGRHFTYHYELADSLPELADADAFKVGLLPQLCPHWGPLFAAGRVVSASYNYRLRERTYSFLVEAEDCP